MPRDNLFKIAHITAAHGIRGEVRLACLLENPDDITRYSPLHTKAGKELQIEITGHQKDQLIVKIDGITDRNGAELLRGTELFADASKRPPTQPNQFYYDDVIGLPAILADGTKIGSVTAIHNFGAGDIIEIKTADDEIMLPFKSPYVTEVTKDAVRVVLPEYLES